MSLAIEQDEQRGTVTIEGTVYAQEVFRQLSHFLPIGQAFAIVSRADGVLTIQRLESMQQAAPGVALPPDRFTWLLHNLGAVNDWAAKEWRPDRHGPLIPWLEQRITTAWERNA